MSQTPAQQAQGQQAQGQQPVQPLHPILDSKENVTKARVQDLVQQQKLQYVSPSDRAENMSPTSKKLINHKMRHLYDNPVKKLSGLRLEAANSSSAPTSANDSAIDSESKENQ